MIKLKIELKIELKFRFVYISVDLKTNMKVLLDQGVLERIVDDGVKEMRAQFNISKQYKQIKEGWSRLVDEISEYGTQIKSGLITVLVQDFSSPVDV